MSTPYDFISVAMFAALAALCLHRASTSEAGEQIFRYLPPALGCAFGNWLGNHDQGLLASLVFGASVAYTITVLKPFSSARS